MQKTSYTFEHITFKDYSLFVQGTYDKGIFKHREHSFSITKVEVIDVDTEDRTVLPVDLNIGDLEDYIIKIKFEQ